MIDTLVFLLRVAISVFILLLLLVASIHWEEKELQDFIAAIFGVAVLVLLLWLSFLI